MVLYRVEDAAEVLERPLVADGRQSREGIALARRIVLLVQECDEQIGSVGQKFGQVGIDGGDSERRVLPYVCVAVGKALAGGFFCSISEIVVWNSDNIVNVRKRGSTSSASRNLHLERCQLLHRDNERVPYRKRNVLPLTYSLGACRSKRMALLLNISASLSQHKCDYAPDQNPLLAQLAVSVVLGADLEEEVHQLLQLLRLARHDESYYVHQQTLLGVAVQHYGEDLLL